MKVTVGVCGGVAAYKAAELVRALQRQALDVHVVMTQAAQQFITPLTFAALTGHKVITGLWPAPNAAGGEQENREESDLDSAIEHIGEAQSTDVLVVAPATANMIANFAHGLASDFLSTLYLATTVPVILAPAMNVKMWEHPATQANIETLENRGVKIVPPGSGYLACGMTGGGRLAEPDVIVQAVLEQLQRSNQLSGEVVLVTAGGTREPIDPVRFIGNRSSGKMGYAVAEAAESRGARVILITGQTSLRAPANCEVVRVGTASEMREAVLSRLDQATIVIKAAAVADYRPRAQAEQKLKRSGPITLEFEPTEDILREVTARKRPGTLVIGFAAETENPLEHGRDKLLRKGVDAIVLNDVSRPGLGFDSDRNAATFLTPSTAIDLPEMSKRELAVRILEEVMALRRPESLLAETGLTSKSASRPIEAS
ncbi:MAG TPA: bifunctional phosphopantothenoylcysteine decarboxylase/phosphopantothenate--cysteine ligase CoaBC [Acidobacteriaceae bacterium]|nr:bifunctional phosphopantothenoylcysteine decarboxylase/phosphopantothenate--cysteine ligase CoaBC [Acidobacteriaceae bacterium]